ncbi:MAG TPA: SpoIIE family protein phosphatase, partial [Armatimonadota bacterium]|nr:SpoIIE family protein phosphatase [Armatimonadota bacterium]
MTDGGAEPRGVILVVDDDPTMRALLKQYLVGWTVEEASDGKAGLEKAREIQPDLVIADWMMPRMLGPEMVRQLRADDNLAHTPIVMLTAMSDVEHRTESYTSGADHFLPKDFQPQELLAIIDRAVERTEPLHYAAPLMRALHDRIEVEDMAQVGEAVGLLGDFQQRMLPPGEATMGPIAVGAHLAPSVIASGDFYDYIPWDDGRSLGFVVGDVSGRGLAAAYFMVMVRTALRVLARESRSLAETMATLNEILMAETPIGWFVTLFYGVVEPRTLSLRYINAGHCPAALNPVKGGQTLLDPTGPALGIFDEPAFEEASVDVQPGDLMVCATDGVIDAIRTQDFQE